MIGKRTLMAEALASCIDAEFGHPVATFSNLESWEQFGSQDTCALILLDLSSDHDGSEEAILQVKKSGSAAPIIVLRIRKQSRRSSIRYDAAREAMCQRASRCASQ